MSEFSTRLAMHKPACRINGTKTIFDSHIWSTRPKETLDLVALVRWSGFVRQAETYGQPAGPTVCPRLPGDGYAADEAKSLDNARRICGCTGQGQWRLLRE